MIKIAECDLCNRWYRSGKVRQVITKEMVADYEGKGCGFRHGRMVICKDCYEQIMRGGGVSQGDVLDMGEQSATESKAAQRVVGELIMTDVKERAVKKDKKEKKERKPRGKRFKVTASNSPLAEALGKGLQEEDDAEDLKAEVKCMRSTTLRSDIASKLNISEDEVADICTELDNNEDGV